MATFGRNGAGADGVKISEVANVGYHSGGFDGVKRECGDQAYHQQVKVVEGSFGIGGYGGYGVGYGGGGYPGGYPGYGGYTAGYPGNSMMGYGYTPSFAPNYGNYGQPSYGGYGGGMGTY